jgi:hypothetical protein
MSVSEHQTGSEAYIEWLEDCLRWETLMTIRNRADIILKICFEQGLSKRLLSSAAPINDRAKAKGK